MVALVPVEAQTVREAFDMTGPFGIWTDAPRAGLAGISFVPAARLGMPRGGCKAEWWVRLR